jgi:outer membrane protein assembly factor BamD (BamD/ComL family)
MNKVTVVQGINAKRVVSELVNQYPGSIMVPDALEVMAMMGSQDRRMAVKIAHSYMNNAEKSGARVFAIDSESRLTARARNRGWQIIVGG